MLFRNIFELKAVYSVILQSIYAEYKKKTDFFSEIFNAICEIFEWDISSTSYTFTYLSELRKKLNTFFLPNAAHRGN